MRPYVNGPSAAVFAKKVRSSAVRTLHSVGSVPGGASAYMLQQVLEKQGGYRYLDAQPKTLAAKEHRPGYGRDGDYHSKPQVEDVVDVIFELIQE